MAATIFSRHPRRFVEQDDDVRYVISVTMPSAALLLLGFG
jgi:hypothetical protein